MVCNPDVVGANLTVATTVVRWEGELDDAIYRALYDTKPAIKAKEDA